MEREHAKKCLKQFFFSNFGTRYSGTNTQGSQEFTLNFSFTEVCQKVTTGTYCTQNRPKSGDIHVVVVSSFA